MRIPAVLLFLVLGRSVVAQDAAATRAEDILSRMTLEEKIAYIGGNRAFIRAIPRLNIPAIKVSDGPVGVRSTAYPAGICLAASWDREMAARLGTALGREARARGVHILLGPALNIYRTPRGGRNFEYMGEDPYLAGQLAAAEVRALQAEGVLATLKHFACNNQEADRESVDARVEERTLREIYLPAFEAAIREGGAQCVMDAFNRLNGVYCAHSAFLNIEVLRKEWGFTGIVMSDWGAAHDGLAAATGGLDLEMPKAVAMTKDRLLGNIESGALQRSVIDDKVRHILRTIIAAGFLDRPQELKGISRNDPALVATALDEARAGIVLLKNEGAVLPLDPAEIRRIAVIGPNAHPAVTGGGGSSWMEPARPVSVLDGLRRVTGIKVTYADGKLAGGRGRGSARSAGFAGGRAEAVAAARGADAAVVCVGFNKDLEGEGSDREYRLPAGQADLIKAVAAVNPRTIVVLFAGGGVGWEGWLDKAPALVHAWYPGQEGGRAIADILFGVVNPSGKLPATFERRARDNPCAPYYLKEEDADARSAIYREGIFVGYRGYDRNKVEPQFCFGHGLSYTSFEYSGLAVTSGTAVGDESTTVTFTVRNTGLRAGAEVAQVYVGEAAASVPRPPRELKGFVKVPLEPGESRRVAVVLPRSAFSFWHPEKKAWVVEPGAFTIEVGASSRDIRLTGTMVRGN